MRTPLFVGTVVPPAGHPSSKKACRQEEGGEPLKQRGERAPVHERGRRRTGQIGDGRRQVVVYNQLLANRPGRHPGATYHQGHPYVLLVGRLLVAPHQPVLPLVEAVVRGEDDVGVAELSGLLERGDDLP